MPKPSSLHEVSLWFIEALPYDVIWIGQSGRIVFANKSFCKSLGYSQAEMKKLTMFDVNPELTAEKWGRHWEIVQQKGVDHFKTTHRKKKGEPYIVEVFSLFFSNNGKNLICAIVRDITESNFYKTILEETEKAVKVGGWKWNRDEKAIIASEEALCIFGLKEAEGLLPSRIIHHFVDQALAREAMRKAVQEGIPYDINLQIRDTAQQLKWVRCIGKPVLRNNRPQKILGTYQDITEQKELELSLKLSDEIINRAKDLIYLIDESGHFVRFNESVVRELGYTREEFNQMSIFDLDVNMTPALWRQHWSEILEKRSFTFERTSVRKDRTQMPIEVTANHLRFNNQDLNCAIVRDITERKKRELALVEALHEIRQLKQQVEAENEYLQEEINRDYHFESIICKSKEYEKVLQQAIQVAATDTTVLITGESGTGKELLARGIHESSRRKERPLIKVNCAALPKELIESELFGHKKGAFTGAIANKTGKFELADKGTLFLDEIGELPLELQPKLLRVLQEGEFDRLGDTSTTRADVRIIAATNRDLELMVKDGAFREDLFYRLNVFPIHSIPLRERREDIPLLAQHFLEKYAPRAGKDFKRISKKALDGLLQYDFPGNIRELENLIERAVILENGPNLLPGAWLPVSKAGKITGDKLLTFEEMQREHILKALFQTQWRVSGDKGAARILGLKDKTLFAKMQKLGIRKEDFLRR
ncbi:MAG: sigma 54-interacting transcriptional regulator [Phaeodactylibacter sp.]|nr:sigma 54-interacting transcriptional regulator [Phaeodactylibacter sp.]MCB9051982.1 sigma 54-interacting transcriptional regulator [Lewinellaceae bacterium]